MKNYFISSLKDKSFLAFFISVIVILIVYLISSFWFFYNLNKSVQNNYYKIKNTILWTKAHENIIVIEIDEKTLDKLWLFPFSRKNYSTFLENLKTTWVAVVGFDIIFTDETNKDEDSDFDFGQSIKNSQNVVLWTFFSEGYIDYPLEEFNKNAKWFGYLSPNIDSINNVVYSVTPFANFENIPYLDHFSFSVLKAFYSHVYSKNFNNFKSHIKDNYYFLTDKIKIPLARVNKKEILINFIDNKQFKKLSFADIYDKKTFDEIKKSTDFKDKIVIVWTAVKGIKDIFYTPNGIEYWVYIHANIINTILNKSYLVYFNKNLEWILIFLLIILSVYSNLNKSVTLLIFSNISIIAIFLFIFPVLILIFTNLIINFPLELLFALVLSLTSSNIIKYLIENKNKNKLNKALSEYVSWDIVSEILSWTWKINLNWDKKEIAIYFSDIEWFTTISEKLSPEKLVSFLKVYLSSVSTIIMQEGGFIDKYEWDSVVAFWWAFSEKGNYCYQACNSALVQSKTLKLLNKKFEKTIWANIKFRVWINFWEAILWNIWAVWKKMEFTALWDNVNLASRLEWVNKFYGTYLCVSESVYKKVKDDFEFRLLDKIKVKWKEKWISIYELLDYKWNLSESQKSMLSNFENALNLYFKMNFKKALKIFEELALKGDNPSKTFVLRCKKFIMNLPVSNWDWFWKMEEK